jgi:hypothetical protein
MGQGCQVALAVATAVVTEVLFFLGGGAACRASSCGMAPPPRARAQGWQCVFGCPPRSIVSAVHGDTYNCAVHHCAFDMVALQCW